VSADNQVHQRQFRQPRRTPIDKILDMPVHPDISYGETVREILPDLQRQNHEYPEYRQLHEHMAQGGAVPPIEIVQGHVYDGLHRIAAAHEHGWTHLSADIDPRRQLEAGK
jgi:hypothetical protein